MPASTSSNPTSSSPVPVLLAGTAVLFTFIWMVTYGTGDVFDRDPFGQFYDAQAKSLLAGHWDVPFQDIHPEAFVRDGKYYGYFGFVPALPRMLLNAVFPSMSGSWSRLSMTLGAAATLVFCYRLLLHARRWVGMPAQRTTADQFAYGGFLLLSGLGSSMIYIGSCAFIYHEAILWAVALALACYDQLFGYLKDARSWRLIAACALAYLSFFCRISTGCGPILTLLLLGTYLIVRPVLKIRPGGIVLLTARRFAHAGIVALALSTIAATYVAVNHAKFGTFFEPAPMNMHLQVSQNPAQWEHTGGKWMSPGNIPTTAYAYLSPGSISFSRTFPWVYLQRDMRSFPSQHMAGNEPFTSVTASMPVLLLLALIGVGTLACSMFSPRKASLRDPTPSKGMSPMFIVIGSLGGVAPILPFCAVANRYLHDFFPFLVLAGAFGLHRLMAVRWSGLRITLVIVLVAVGIFQIYANCSFALVYQRLEVFSHPARPAEQMRKWQRSIDDAVAPFFLHGR